MSQGTLRISTAAWNGRRNNAKSISRLGDQDTNSCSHAAPVQTVDQGPPGKVDSRWRSDGGSASERPSEFASSDPETLDKKYRVCHEKWIPCGADIDAGIGHILPRAGPTAVLARTARSVWPRPNSRTSAARLSAARLSATRISAPATRLAPNRIWPARPVRTADVVCSSSARQCRSCGTE